MSGIPSYPRSVVGEIARLRSQVNRLETTARNQQGTARPLRIRDSNVATRTASVQDIDAFVRMNRNTLPQSFVLPNSAAGIPVGRSGRVAQYGTGLLTIVAGAGVTIHSADEGRQARTRYAGALWIYLGANAYWLQGDLTA